MALVSNSWESLSAWWQTATPATRAAATGMAALLLVGLIVAISLAAGPDYRPIYHGVTGKEAANIETILQGHAIPMKFDENNGTINVPSKDESSATMYIEAENVLSKDANIVGIESLDKIGMGTSTEVERARILAANEGELERKLMQLDPVQTATVALSSGNDSSLFSSEVSPSASVILTLKRGESLDPNQVKGIVYFIAHAVPGLTPHNVTLTDQTGAPLWRDNGVGGNALGDGQPLDESAKYAEMVRKKVQDVLDSTLGPRKSIVTVNAELDFDQTQTDSLEHTPVPGTHSGLPVSTHSREESYTGSGAAGAGGIAGASSNLQAPSYTSGGGASGSGGAYKSTDETTNYDNNTTHTVIQKAPGGIRKLSVAALVDAGVPATDVDKIKSIIATAIGAAPGDATRFVTVQQIAFDTSAQRAVLSQMAAARSQELMGNIARALAVCAVAGLLLFLLFRSGQRAEPQMALAGGGSLGMLEKAAPEELESMLEERPLRIEDVLAEMPEPAPRRPKPRMRAPSIEEHQDIKLESIQDMITTHAESVALLMKGWMVEEPKIHT